MKFKTFINNLVKYYKLAGLYFMKFFKKYYLIIGMAAVTLVALVARYMFVMYPTNDMVGYVLNSWMPQIDELGFSNFYQVDSDYSPLYLLTIAILCLLPKGKEVTYYDNSNWSYNFYDNRMIYVKTFYYLVTIALAIGVFLLVKELTKSKNKAFIGYVVALALPTIFINSAIWGNADVIYATFLIFSFYFAVKGDSIWSMVFFGLSFANKAQAIFILPFLIYLLASRKLKLWTIVLVPVTYFLTFLPAFIFGAHISEPFVYLGKQFSGQTDITYGCANVWKFMELDKSEIVRNNAMWASILVIGVMLAVVYLRNIKLSKKENMFKVGFLLTITTIFFLPRLHERYFYIIDVLVVVYALIDKRRFFLVPLMQLSSGIAYFHYLTGHYFIDIIGENSVTIAACINLFILCVALYDVFKLEHKTHEEDVIEIESEIKELSPKKEVKEEPSK